MISDMITKKTVAMINDMITKKTVAIYLAWWTPAIVGAALSWPWWVTVSLVVPGIVWSVATDGVDIYRNTISAADRTTLASRVPFIYTLSLIVTTLPLLVGAGGVPSRYSGLLVAFDITIVDLRYVRFRSNTGKRQQ